MLAPSRVSRPRSLPLLLVLIVGVLASLIPATPSQAQPGVTITENFKNATAPNWDLSGSAVLTGNGTIDPAGDGWLRLTDDGTQQAGSAIYTQAFPSTFGIQVAFEYATYGGDGADGFSFYLIDGTTTTPTVGAPGGGLGYSQRKIPTSSLNDPGVTNGYVGIGFDEFGNFTAAESGGCAIACAISANTVSIRGSGSLTTDGAFRLLAKAPLSPRSIDGVTRANARQVRITILNQRITVEMNFGAGFEKVIDQYNLATAPGQVATPATFKMGFSGSTGGSTNFHEIRSLTVGGAQVATTTLTSSRNPSAPGEAVTFTATVSGSNGTPTGTVTFKNGQTVLGTGTLNASGVATFTTSALPLGSHNITATYGGSGVYAASTSPVLVQLVTGPDLTLTQRYVGSFINKGTFTITVRNAGPGSANGAVVTDAFPTPSASGMWTWTCVASGGASCGATSGTGNLNQTLPTFPVGGQVVYTVVGQSANWSQWTNTATVATPAGITDRNLSNNTSTINRILILLPIVAK